ncbi:acyl-CoA dehydrogenase family protein [Clostridium sp. AN503]|uniref:acyl-CoA dehydrogenase family protein n=1 Tax=Clostridium sp. AN503 TaxID=3160598 RepID=UPI00345AC3A2
MSGLYHMTEDQQSLVELIRDFMNREIRPHVLEWEKEGHYPREIIQMGIDMGLHMMQVPEEYGGMGLDTTTTAMMIEEGAKVESTYMGMFNVTSMGGKIVMAAGSEEQKQYYAGLLQKGYLSAFCLTEPGAGSDSAAVRTTAVRDGDSYVIGGTKMFITNASLADVFLVVASVDPSKGSRGLATFIVERDCPGVSVSKKIDKFGMRLSNTAEVIFEDVKIPAANLVGTEESGFANAMKVLTASRPIIAASSLGACQLARDLAVQYSKERVAFGKPICAKQMIQEKLANMEILIQASRGLVYNATMLLDQGKPCNTEASVAKCFVTEAFGTITDDALQIFGGYGLCDEYLISKLYRDARVNRIVEGTNEIQRVVISKAMLR